MQHRWTYVVYILFFCTVGCGDVGSRQEPIFQGVILSEWVDRLGDIKASSSEKEKAAQAVQSIGTNAIPFLIGQIKQGDVINGQRRMGVVWAFSALGDSGKTAIPLLTQIAIQQDPKSAYTALWCLSNMGSLGTEAMPLVLTSSNLTIRRSAAQMLYTLGTNAHSSVSFLLSHLKNKEDDYETAFWTGSAVAAATLQPHETIAALLRGA